jgi:putative acetyltransferase
VPELALVAEIDGEITGHVMISYARLRNDRTERKISMLSPLAVLPSCQRVGIGSALVNATLAVAEARSEPLVILEGDPAHYGRRGSEHSQRPGIEIHLPEWAPPEAAQVKLLNTYDPDDPSLRGTVIYPTAFDGLE